MNSIANDIPNDILLLIFETLQDDYSSLFRSALVNRTFNQASSKYLYRRVVLAPRYWLVLSLRELDPILVRIPCIPNRKSSSRNPNQGKFKYDLSDPSPKFPVRRNCRDNWCDPYATLRHISGIDIL